MRLLIACLLSLTLAACDKRQPAAPQGEAARAPAPKAGFPVAGSGDQAPAVPFTGPDGAPATLASFRGRPLLVNLWATWCAPCVAEMPTLDRLAAQEAGRMAVVAVSQDGNGKAAVAPFFARIGGATLKPYLDPQNVLMMAMRADTLPTTVLYDAKGRELWRHVGSMDWAGAEARTKIAAELANAG